MKQFRALMFVVMVSLCVGCHPQPPPPTDGAAVAPSTWADTAERVADVASWALPALRGAVSVLPLPEPVRAPIVLVLDELRVTGLGALRSAVAVYRERGGGSGRCEAYAALGALRAGLLTVCDRLSTAGYAWPSIVGGLIDAAAGAGDQLAGACEVDAGLRSLGGEANAALSRWTIARGPLRAMPELVRGESW